MDYYDDTLNDHERFERRQLAQDRDRRRQGVLSIDEQRAAQIVRALREQHIVDVQPEGQLLIHTPTGTKFEDDRALVYFHRGWQAADDSDS
ncbi:hypothetical protein ACFR9U_14695 [Halorientalis brevis]|uniref:DUF8069 domain-containing protein n=1 Tax=Halorientalis brevis TaxID=1126241 RepID=A0ABD6CEK3_9EURY|nr:hypothetical protein [Halorientalis brevis]